MSRRTAGLGAMLAVAMAIVIPTLAGAAGGKSHDCQFSTTARIAQTRKISGDPPLSGSAEGAGTLDGTLCGKASHGAVRGVNKYPSAGKFTFTTRSFGRLGSWKSTGSGTGTLNPDGSATIAGSGTIVSGTGAFAGATGSFSFTGKEAKNSTVSVLHITGNVKY